MSWILRGDGGGSAASSTEGESHIAPQSHRPSDSTAIDRQSKEGTQRRLSSKTPHDKWSYCTGVVEGFTSSNDIYVGTLQASPALTLRQNLQLPVRLSGRAIFLSWKWLHEYPGSASLAQYLVASAHNHSHSLLTQPSWVARLCCKGSYIMLAVQYTYHWSAPIFGVIVCVPASVSNVINSSYKPAYHTT